MLIKTSRTQRIIMAFVAFAAGLCPPVLGIGRPGIVVGVLLGIGGVAAVITFVTATDPRDGAERVRAKSRTGTT